MGIALLKSILSDVESQETVLEFYVWVCGRQLHILIDKVRIIIIKVNGQVVSIS